MANQGQTNPSGSLRLTPDLCQGRSGEMLLAVLRGIAPDHVRLTMVHMVRDEQYAKLTLHIYWRPKDRYPHSTAHIHDDHSLRFEVDYWNPELPAEVILAKLALI